MVSALNSPRCVRLEIEFSFQKAFNIGIGNLLPVIHSGQDSVVLLFDFPSEVAVIYVIGYELLEQDWVCDGLLEPGVRFKFTIYKLFSIIIKLLPESGLKVGLCQHALMPVGC